MGTIISLRFNTCLGLTTTSRNKCVIVFPFRKPWSTNGLVLDINSHSVEIELIQLLNNNGASAVYEKQRERLLDRGLWNVRTEKCVKNSNVLCRAKKIVMYYVGLSY